VAAVKTTRSTLLEDVRRPRGDHQSQINSAKTIRVHPQRTSFGMFDFRFDDSLSMLKILSPIFHSPCPPETVLQRSTPRRSRSCGRHVPRTCRVMPRTPLLPNCTGATGCTGLHSLLSCNSKE
jgi:hypothetical protein